MNRRAFLYGTLISLGTALMLAPAQSRSARQRSRAEACLRPSEAMAPVEGCPVPARDIRSGIVDPSIPSQPRLD